jgi:ferredoxin/flavodoxin---NADP+ reductase
MTAFGTSTQPLRVAIIGAGPAGFYAADHLLKQKNLSIQVDLFDRLPTPFGLVRGGVAPDHQKIKSVTAVYDKTAKNPNFRFFGNVTFGRDLTIADVQQHYNAVLFSVGAQTDKRLGIPGEDLINSHAATEFVGWYNGHPDYRHLQFDLSQTSVAIIGVGNVAMDVARILARSQAELDETDIASYAQEALAKSNIREIYILGRRGPAQAAFTNPEIKELGEMQEADVIVTEREVTLDPATEAYLASPQADRSEIKNVEILKSYTTHPLMGKPRRLIFRFLVSPTEILGTEKVEGLRIVHNEAYQDDKGEIRARATTETEVIPVGLVFRSVGYYGVALPGIPFDEKKGVIPNVQGRILTQAGGDVVTGEYVAGWIKRGPSGVIGTNKQDAVETANLLLEDAQAGNVWLPSTPQPDAIEALLRERGVRIVTYADWQCLNDLEVAKAEGTARPRVKFTEIDAMLSALDEQGIPETTEPTTSGD